MDGWEPSAGWFGSGIYFWDGDEKTGRWWAGHHYGEDEPHVIRARLDLSDCLDLCTVTGQNLLKAAFAKINKIPELATEFATLTDADFSHDGAVIELLRNRLSQLTSGRLPARQIRTVRVATQQADDREMERVGGGDLLVGFRMVIIVYDKSAIQEPVEIVRLKEDADG